MKKMFLMALATVGALMVSAKELSLAEARAKIGTCIDKPAEMTATIKQLAKADQAAFIADVNLAISKMPGSNEAKAAKFLNVNHAALKGAAKGNLTTLVAEVFATVPAEVLPLINERFAEDLFSRSADPSVTYTDAQFTEIAKKLIEKVNERMEKVENGAARTTFAILMMVRASNGSPANLVETLVALLPESAQAEARSNWIPAALGDNQKKTYEPLLGAAEALGQLPANELVIRIAGPQMLDSLLGDIVEGTPHLQAIDIGGRTPIIPMKDEVVTPAVPVLPVEPEPVNPEPGGYQGQET